MKISARGANFLGRTAAGYGAAMGATPRPLFEPRAFAWGFGWLVVGFAVYQVARPPNSIAFLPGSGAFGHLPSHLISLFGSAPTFVHALAFSLMSASIVGTSRERIALVCGGWGAVDVAFEVVQLPAFGHWLLLHPAAFSALPILRAYVIRGTFDNADIAAAILGAGFAALTLTLNKEEMNDD